MLIALTIIVVLVSIVFLYMQHPKFGKAPSGERLEAIKKSPNFKNGRFENINHTPEITEGYTYREVLYEFLFKKTERKSPLDSIPSIKTDLKHLTPNQDVLVWFGHSSYFMQIDGVRILVDPVFSGNASPVAGTTKSFKGADVYTVADLPTIDYLLISHDHYDHIDYKTIVQLKEKTKKVICGLGVGSHFEHWGYSVEKIIEKDWHEKVELDSGFILYTTPTRHFSGRTFKRCNTLWLSYVLQTPSLKLFIGGDSGYDNHYTEIGNKYGPFDLAILDNGQYDPKWRYIHHAPHEVLQATSDLQAKRLLPVHSSKFALANHAWDEPLTKIIELNKKLNIPLLTPMIGEVVSLKDEQQVFKQWWLTVK